MRLFGKQPTGRPTLPPQEVTARLMSLNRPTAPYQIVDDRAEGADLIAEWKIVDARWYKMNIRAITIILLALAVTLACNLVASPGVSAPPSAPPVAPAGIPTAPTAPASLAVCQDEACMASGLALSYLVVTRPLFTDALIPFVNWKSGQGYRVGLVTVDWLAQRFPARHLAESMKTGMHTLRRNTGAQYVLLVGDTQITRGDWDVNTVLASYTLTQFWNVPTGFSRQLNSDPPGVVVPDDTYFVEERDWDPQNTGLNPRTNLDSGVMPVDATLFLGRWPVRKPEEIAPIFAKTQSLSVTNKIFFIWSSEFTPASPIDYPRLCPTLPFPEWSCYSYDHAQQRLFGQNASWLTTETLAVDTNDPQQAGMIQQRLSGFDGVILENFHGAYDFLQMPASEALSSNHYPMLIVTSCNAFAFYSGSPDTLSESLLKSSSGPAIVAMPPNYYLFLMYLREGRPVGQAFWRSAELSGGSAVLMGDSSLTVLQPPPGQ